MDFGHLSMLQTTPYALLLNRLIDVLREIQTMSFEVAKKFYKSILSKPLTTELMHNRASSLNNRIKSWRTPR